MFSQIQTSPNCRKERKKQIKASSPQQSWRRTEERIKEMGTSNSSFTIDRCRRHHQAQSPSPPAITSSRDYLNSPDAFVSCNPAPPLRFISTDEPS
jgi:hypothetical protein